MAKALEFQLCISPSSEYSGFISFRIDWVDLLAVQWTLKNLLTVQEHQFWFSAFFMVQFSHPYMTIGKTIALTRRTFVGKVTSLLLNMLSRLVIAFLPRIKRRLISWLQSPSTVISEPKKIKSVALSIISPPVCHEVMGLDAMIFVFWMLSFLSQLFHSPLFTFIKRHFCCSSLSAIRVVSSAYLRLLIFHSAILIPPCASSSVAFCVMYSAYKLNKQGDNIQPWRTPFPIWNHSVVPCPVLTVASWPVYRFHRRQESWSEQSLKNVKKYGLKVNILKWSFKK